MFQLHNHQENVYNQIKESIRKGHKKILVAAPTGFGKTILSYQIIKDCISKGTRSLFTSHRITLAEQSKEVFKSLNPAYLQGDADGFDDENLVLVATLQTLLNREVRSDRKIILMDEVHYGYKSEIVQSLFTRFPNAIFIALSATPVDSKGFLLEGFDCIIDTYQTSDMIKMGFLTPFICHTPTVNIDLAKIKVSKTTDDYQEKSISEAVNKPDINKSIVTETIRLFDNRKFILYAQNTAHCIALQELFAAYGIKTATILSSTTKKNRDKAFEQFKNGELHGLISIEILVAGHDDPTVSCIILAFFTLQWRKFIQCCGRGIRLLGKSLAESINNGKSDCLLIDFGNNIEEHGLPDERFTLKFGTKVSKVIDRMMNMDVSLEERQEFEQTLTEEKQVFLKRIGSLLDIYDGRVYTRESDLQDDVNKFLKRTGYFFWRQNSGKAFMEGRWVHFASKAGLPDNSVFYSNTSFYIGMELKLKRGKLTTHQKETLPEMIANNVLFFICESVMDVFLTIKHVEENIQFTDTQLIINNSIYILPEWQQEKRKRLNLI